MSTPAQLRRKADLAVLNLRLNDVKNHIEEKNYEAALRALVSLYDFYRNDPAYMNLQEALVDSSGDYEAIVKAYRQLKNEASDFTIYATKTEKK